MPRTSGINNDCQSVNRKIGVRRTNRRSFGEASRDKTARGFAQDDKKF